MKPKSLALLLFQTQRAKLRMNLKKTLMLFLPNTPITHADLLMASKLQPERLVFSSSLIFTRRPSFYHQSSPPMKSEYIMPHKPTNRSIDEISHLIRLEGFVEETPSQKRIKNWYSYHPNLPPTQPFPSRRSNNFRLNTRTVQQHRQRYRRPDD